MPSSRPVIGVTCGTSSSRGQAPRFGANQAYIRSLEAAGATAVLVPPMPGADAAALLRRLDALLIPGGADIEPRLYGQEPGPHMGEPDPARDALEVHLVRAATRRGMPVFGICRGLQLVNVAFGGTLYQDLRAETGTRVRHSSPKSWPRDRLVHSVAVAPGSWLEDAVRARALDVNSTHHQAARDVGRGLRVTATGPDGVVEAVESRDGRVLAVQCHPEELPEAAWARNLFRRFVGLARD